MFSHLPLTMLVAQINPFESTQRYLHRPLSYDGLGWVLLLVVIVAVVTLILVSWEQIRRALPNTSVKVPSLWESLCDVHQLEVADRNRLEQLAQRCELTDPALAFIDPAVLERLTADGEPDREAVKTLGARLFGSVFQPASPVGIPSEAGATVTVGNSASTLPAPV